ncbi:unnamed protein product [Bathycoccus prasinos]|mmetsp:Transcript_7745/g.24275  ORF Transcript_7745/g.24275 Transcript_7745/m.24275 type:complete len:291 (+) Transcript_7745:63-935(+)
MFATTKTSFITTDANAFRGGGTLCVFSSSLKSRRRPKNQTGRGFEFLTARRDEDDEDEVEVQQERRHRQHKRRKRREIMTTTLASCALTEMMLFITREEQEGEARAADEGGKMSDFSNLKILLSEIKRADAELSQMIGQLQRASDVGTDAPLELMSYVFENRDSAIYNFQKNALKLDAFVDAEELTPIEAAVWDSIPQKNGGGVHTPFIVTPNEFVCALYSCVNSPDAPPSTEAALTIDMLRKGVAMGKRKDKRITSEGLLLTAEDARGKVQRYLEILESSGIFSRSSSK